MTQDDKNGKDDIDWENRVLCSDGNCIGVIGADGKCKECGLMAEQVEADADLPESESFDSYDDKNETHPLEDDEEATDVGDDWEGRTLCSDENCIGTIGPDGTCNECGKQGS